MSGKIDEEEENGANTTENVEEEKEEEVTIDLLRMPRGFGLGLGQDLG